MIVLIASPYTGFPNGTASTSRITAFARGLAAAGESVHLILLGPSEIDESTAVNTSVSGVHHGIPFEYTSVSTIKSPSLLKRRWRVWSSLWRARRQIRDLDARFGVDAVLISSLSGPTIAFFSRVSRSVGALYLLNLCEMPFYSMHQGPARDAKQATFARRSLHRFDLVVAISRCLADYAKPHLRPGTEAVVVPIMVDCDEYVPQAAPSNGRRRIVYVGMLNERKDGVASLLRAFASIAVGFPDVDLRLVGDSDDARLSKVPEFRALAESLGVVDRVEFAGQVRRADIAHHLAEASVLVLARPSSQQADAGFPTKLGEYLASGTPTVVTRTSDIPIYLRDAESAYLVAPDDAHALAVKLREALTDPDALEVGISGRRVAEEHFDYRVAGSTLRAALDRARLRRGSGPGTGPHEPSHEEVERR